MDVFGLRQRLIDDYASYTRSFIKIADPIILKKVDTELTVGAFWPEPLLQINPTFQSGGTIDDLVAGTLHPECVRVFRIDKSEQDHTSKQPLLPVQENPHTYYKAPSTTRLSCVKAVTLDALRMLSWPHAVEQMKLLNQSEACRTLDP